MFFFKFSSVDSSMSSKDQLITFCVYFQYYIFQLLFIYLFFYYCVFDVLQSIIYDISSAQVILCYVLKNYYFIALTTFQFIRKNKHEIAFHIYLKTTTNHQMLECRERCRAKSSKSTTVRRRRRYRVRRVISVSVSGPLRYHRQDTTTVSCFLDTCRKYSTQTIKHLLFEETTCSWTLYQLFLYTYVDY